MPRARSIRSVWSRVATASVTVVSPPAASAASRIADLTWALGTAVRHAIGESRARPVISSGRSVPPPRPAIVGAHRGQRLGHPAHRPPAERGVAVEDREQVAPREQPRDEARRRPGVAAVEDAVRLDERVAARRDHAVVHAPVVLGNALHGRAECGADPRGGPDVLAVARRRDRALALGEQREEERPVRDRLVAGQRG